MKSKQKYFILLGLIIIIIIIIFNILLLNKNSDLKKTIISNNTNNTIEAEKVKNLLKDDFLYGTKSEITIVSIPLIDSKNNQIQLSDLLLDKNMFVYYFRGKGCSTCFETEIINIKENYSLNNNENLIVVSNFKTIEEQKTFEINYRVKTFDINDYNFNIYIENLDEPFYFNISKNLNISNVYRPTNFFQERSEIYYNHINSFF